MPEKGRQMSTASEHAGRAALSICEALLLALKDRGVLPEHDIVGLLRDAAATHENAVGTELEMENHRAVAGLINAIMAGGNLSQAQRFGQFRTIDLAPALDLVEQRQDLGTA